MAGSRLDIEVTRAGSTTIVRPVGPLDIASASELRGVLLKSLADEPRGVIVQTDGLLVDSLAMMSLFASVARKAADWPGVRVALVIVDGPLADLVAGSALLRFVPVYGTIAAAAAAFDHPPLRRLATLFLPAAVTSAALARRFVADTCAAWNIPEIADDAMLVVSELAANAFEHARSDARLRLELRRDLLTLAVRDDDPTIPIHKTPASDAMSGRGIMLVAKLSRAWGASPTWTGGKVVWAVLPIR